MTSEKLELALHAQPFRPFTFRLGDERAMAVVDPKYVNHTPGSLKVSVARGDGGTEVLDLTQIVGIAFGIPVEPGAPTE